MEIQNMTRGSKLKPEPDRQHESKLRQCLRCGKRFLSEHIGERLCPKCKRRISERETT